MFLRRIQQLNKHGIDTQPIDARCIFERKMAMRVKFLIVISLLFIACEKVDNDTALVCTDNCTRIEGRIYTTANQPLKNVQIVFQYIDYLEDGRTYYRKIDKVKTDSEGFYTMDFFLNDEELGSTNGRFELYIKDATLRSDLLYEEFNLNYGIEDIESRDVVVTRNAFFATKKNVKIQLQNFAPLTPGDQFQVQVEFPTGFDNDDFNSNGTLHQYQNSGINRFVASGPSTEFTIPVANGELNFIKIIKTKNGVYTTETFPIVFNSAAPSTLTYQF